MQEVAIYYFVVAWLACWEVDLTVMIIRGPLMIDSILKWIIVLFCLVIILWNGAHSNFFPHKGP